MQTPGDIHNTLAALMNAGRLDAAEKLIQSLPKRAKRDPDIIHRSAVIAHRRGDWREAVKRLDALHKLIGRETPATLMLKGTALRKLGKLDAAVLALKRAARLAPDNADIAYNLGNALLDRGDHADAVAAYGTALAGRPDDADALYQRGLALSRAGEPARAISDLEAAARLQPGNPQNLAALGAALIDADRFSEAETALRDALIGDADNIAALNNLGNALLWQGRHDEGLAAFARAHAIAPDDDTISRNYGMARVRGGDYAGARPLLEHAVAARPEDAETAFELANLLISMGEAEAGWDLWWRHMAKPDARSYDFPLPWWNGEAAPDARLLVWSDQGVGDIVMFAQVLPDLGARFAHVALTCDRRLVPLFQRSFPKVEIVAAEPGPDRHAVDPKRFDLQIPITFAVRWLTPDPRSRPAAAGAYLAADPDLTSHLRAKYRALTDKAIVGIAWRSGNRNRAERNIPLAEWGPILGRDDLSFVNLQYGDTADEVARAQAAFGADIHTDRDIDQMASLDDFAAQVAAMDRIVSISNTTVHMAGALDIEVRLMIPKLLDWRYGIAGPRSAWYGRTTYYRQHEPGGWADVIDRVAADL